MKKAVQGFTLIELMVTLVVASILMSIAVPSFNGMIQSYRLTSSYNAMVGEVTYARSEAVKRGVSVSICPSTDGATCNSIAWESGTLVFTDADSDGDYEGGDNLLKVFQGSSADVSIRSSAFADTGAIIFSDDGSLGNLSGGSVDTGTLFVCGPQGDASARGINLSLLGQPQKAVDSDSNGTIDDVAGGEVSC